MPLINLLTGQAGPPPLSQALLPNPVSPPSQALVSNHTDLVYHGASTPTRRLKPSNLSSLVPAGLWNCSIFHRMTSQACLIGGRVQDARFYLLRNAEFRNGSLQIHGGTESLGEERKAVQSCFLKCRPSYIVRLPYPFEIVSGGNHTRAPTHARNYRTCQKVAWSFRTFRPTTNFYHFVLDRVFVAFVTVANLGRYTGRPADTIDIYYPHGFWATGKFLDVWLKLLPPVLSEESFSGCYSHVFYGSFWGSNYWYNFARPAVLLDKVIGGWLQAYSLNQRHRWMGMFAHTHHGFLEPFILPLHKSRGTINVWQFNWEAALSKLNCSIKIVRHNLATYSFRKQASIIQNAKGIVGATGAQFVWLLWLKPHSAALVIHQPEINREAIFVCKRIPLALMDGIAANIGHTLVSWRFCGKHSAFPSVEPARVLNHLAMLHDEAAAAGQAKACWILRKHALWSRLPSWRWCDLNVSLGRQDRLPSWPPYSHVGENLAAHVEAREWLNLMMPED